VTRSFTLSPGARVSSSTLLRRPAVARWLLGEWSIGPRWTMLGSVGASRQLPELLHVRGDDRSAGLQAERATNMDVGIERKLSAAIRLQATAFYRIESDVLRPPETYPRLVDGVIVFPSESGYANALRGTSRGLELLVVRNGATGLSGWAAYSYGQTRQTDPVRNETYWADFDQRHTLNAFTVYRFREGASVAATLRAGSSLPVPASLVRSGDRRLFVALALNQVRLPVYSRLDLRTERRFHLFDRGLTLFAEALNALNRGNVGLADGSINPVTAEAEGFTSRLLRRRLSGGAVIEF
jgi:hypothetical protein